MKKRWEQELDNPEPTIAVYITKSTVEILRYYLSHLTREDSLDVSLSEAMDKLCSEWNRLDNLRLRCEHRHVPYEKLIDKKHDKKHRKCTKDKCVRKDWDICPNYEW